MAPLIKVKNLKKSFESSGEIFQVFEGLTFSLSENSSTALIGESGSGKTTLIHILAGLEPPSSGSVIVSGNEIWRQKEKERARGSRSNSEQGRSRHWEHHRIEGTQELALVDPESGNQSVREEGHRKVPEEVRQESRLDRDQEESTQEASESKTTPVMYPPEYVDDHFCDNEFTSCSSMEESNLSWTQIGDN